MGGVVSVLFAVAWLLRPEQMFTVEILKMAVIGHAEHEGLLRKTRIGSDDITTLVDKEQVVEDLDRAGLMRLPRKGLPDAPDGCWTHAHGLCHRACTPIRGSLQS
jgi:hypothetical protein